MTHKPEEAGTEQEIELDGAEVPGTDPRAADVPFDPWGTEEEESDRRRDPLRSPV